jgi:hypothetical protein
MEKGEKNGDPFTLEFFVGGKPAGYIENDLEEVGTGMAHVYRVVGYSVFFFHLDNKNDAHFEIGRGATARGSLSVAKNYVVDRYSKRVSTNPEYDPIEVRMGTKVEMEHTDDPKKAERIAKEHLDEHPDYYSRLKSAGLSNPPVSPEEKRIKREMEDLESQKMKIFFTARDSMFPIPPSATGLYQFPPEMIKIVEKTIKPQITEIDNRLRELRAEKKALKAIKPVRAPKGPSRVVTHLGRCRQCDQKVKFLDRPGVRMDGAGPKQTWVGIACPKCGGALGRTSIDGIKWDEVIDLDARK